MTGRTRGPVVQKGTAMCLRNASTVLSLLALSSAIAHAQVDPNSGVDFVTVGAAGNAPYVRPGGSAVDQLGGVEYEYRIGRTEVTTAQWAEFLNAVYDRPAGEVVRFRSRPQTWGASFAAPLNATNPDAQRWSVSAGREMIPVGGISWRAAAMYCNWLHNDKQSNVEAFATGAYDLVNAYTSTARLPGARYFLPTHSEWIKAVHYDPTKQNADGTVGGYWNYGNRSDVPFVGGPPGVLVNGQLATSNTGWGFGDYGNLSPTGVRLGSYADVESPWGLLDVSGGTSEWMETASVAGDLRGPRFDGSRYTHSVSSANEMDGIRGYGGEYSLDGVFSGLGLRVGMIVPTPSTASVGVIGFIVCLRRRR
jgi:formylglycine-generating enzyme required for sulfatase activity